MRLPPLASCVCAFVLAYTAFAAEASRTFDLPAGDAADTLRRFAQQAGREIVYPANEVRGHQTNAVRGELPVAEALRQLLAGTALVAELDRQTGAYAVRKGAADPNVGGPASRAARPANNPAPGAGEEAVQLSPFIIRETSETGWIATETLAGSRIRTDLRDVPNQIETLTKEFMQDLGLNDVDAALIYSANTDNQSENLVNPGDETQFPNGTGRVRGIGTSGATRSRNFFRTRSPTDNYNIDRATVASGPNAILFGLGSPQGIIDTTPARALLRNRYGFTLQYDSEDSKRATFDANVVVAPQKLSLRVMGLSRRLYTEKKPNFDRNDRLYGTLTFKPFANTTLSVQGERNSRTVNNAGRTAPFDFITNWLNADRIPGSPYTTARPLIDNRVAGASGYQPAGNNPVFSRQGAQPVMIQGEGTALRSWNNAVTGKGPWQLPGVEPTFDAGKTHTLLDPSLFPFDVNLLGTTRGNNLDSYHKTVVLEQKLADRLFLELAYNHENSNNEILTVGGNPSGTQIRVQVDANRFIPGTNTPNPHAGEYYIQGTSANRIQYFSYDDWRATLSYEFDAARKLGPRHAWLKWLGRHRAMGLYSQSNEENLNQNTFQYRIIDNPVLPGVTLTPKTTQNWANNATRTPQYRHYLGNPYEPQTAYGPMKGETWTINDANGQPFNLYYVTPLRSPEGKRLGPQAAPSGVKNRTDSQIFVWQGFFLPDREQRERLVLTYGYRKDRVRTARYDNASLTQDFSGMYPVLWDATWDGYGPAQSGTVRNTGLVVRPLSWLSLSYNKSTSFDLNISRYGPFGNELPGASGEGRDYGVRLDLWKNKLSLKVNKYETAQGPTRAIEVINTYKNNFALVENRVMELDPSLPQINVKDGNRLGFPVLDNNNYNVNSDFSGKGYEAELNFTPVRNWNIRLNGSKARSSETNIGKEWFQWIEQRLPIWQGVVAKNGEVDSAGRPVTWNTAPSNVNQPDGSTLAQYYQNTVVGRALAYISAVEGRANPGAREGRVNLITNYRFSEGRLRGFNVGGALRYRKAPVIGYGLKTSAGGETVLDLNTKYKGKDERYVDFMAGYRGRLKAFGGMNWRLQLNLRNLLNDHDPVPFEALSTGYINKIVTVDRRLTAITFGVDF